MVENGVESEVEYTHRLSLEHLIVRGRVFGKAMKEVHIDVEGRVMIKFPFTNVGLFKFPTI